MPAIRYRFYWSVGSALGDYAPDPSAIRYTEFTPRATHHFLFSGPVNRSGPALNPDGSLSDALLAVRPAGGLLDGLTPYTGQDLMHPLIHPFSTTLKAAPNAAPATRPHARCMAHALHCRSVSASMTLSADSAQVKP